MSDIRFLETAFKGNEVEIYHENLTAIALANQILDEFDYADYVQVKHVKWATKQAEGNLQKAGVLLALRTLFKDSKVKPEMLTELRKLKGQYVEGKYSFAETLNQVAQNTLAKGTINMIGRIIADKMTLDQFLDYMQGEEVYSAYDSEKKSNPLHLQEEEAWFESSSY